MLVNLGINLLGVLTFLFIFWKRLKEDYAHEIIFKSALYITTGIAVGSVIAFRFTPPWFLWLEFLGAGCGIVISLLILKTRFYETFESLVIAALPWIGLVFLNDSVGRSSLSSFLGFLTTLAFILLYYYLDSHYKKFSWYKSGKIGFSGLVTLGIIFLTRAVVAVSESVVLSFVNKYEVAFSVTAAFLCFLAVFNLARKI